MMFGHAGDENGVTIFVVERGAKDKFDKLGAKL
jgi:hypothetical protein